MVCKIHAILTQPMTNKTNYNLSVRVFPRLAPVMSIFFLVVIGPLHCLRLLRLAKVIAMVLVLGDRALNSKQKDSGLL